MGRGRYRRADSLILYVAGGVFGFVAAWIGIPLWAIIAVTIAVVALAAVAGGPLFVRYVAPRRIHAAVLKIVDPASGPPEDAEPVAHDIVDEIMEAGRRNDLAMLRSFLTDDFTMIDAFGRRFDRTRYLRALETLRRAYPDIHMDVDAVLARPAEPDVLWLCTQQLGHPRRGPAYDVTGWTRMTLAPGGRQVREMATAGVVRAD